MSQTMPNHILRVGQTICVASPEENGNLRPAGCPGSLSISPKCSYFSTERWHDQSVVKQPHGGLHSPSTNPTCAFSHSGPTFRELERTTHSQGNGQPCSSMHKVNPAFQPKREVDGEARRGGQPMSPTLDVSIENLNQLILELDPTFQPIPARLDSIRKSLTPAISPGWTATTGNADAGCSDIKCIDVQPSRVRCHEAIQRCASPSVSASGDCILVPRGTQRENCTPNGSVIFSSSPSTGRQCYPASDSMPIPPQQQPQDCITPGFEDTWRPQYVARAQHRASGLSMLSNSPGSDTSYFLGSVHSLTNNDSDSHQHVLISRSTGSLFGSIGSFANLNSPSITSPTIPKNYFNDPIPEAFSPGPYQTATAYSSKNRSGSPPYKGEHANSCPPSVTSSTVDIPILLVNGCLERGDLSPNPSKSHRTFGRRRISSNCNPFSEPGNLNKTFSDSSLSASLDGPGREGQPTMKFVMDTSKYWFKPSITRDQAIDLLKNKEPGSFVIRDSTSFRGSFGLAMKIQAAAGTKTGDDTLNQVRHFLIESSAKGVHLKGAAEEPYFGSLSALVYQHAIMPLSLPCKLFIPKTDFVDGEGTMSSSPELAVSQLTRAAACNVLYLNSVSTETLTGGSAVHKAVSTTFESEALPVPTIVHFKATEQGITLTDVQRKVFFRRHYPLTTLSFCGVDPENRTWQKHCRTSRIFGFVAKSPTAGTENVCHLFAEYDVVQPISPVISLVGNLLQSLERI
ncbi:tensin-4 [Rhinatrema bivittatum]|uniref:tensin-4 n=1 Tax=Rhinatrema bivittatum TaxID=194408 RepID=UPI00112C361A|nr:tensin-4 [Rhinatrema bivittatum]XP_029429150.1 tensin-4 [Rhinatrema bivittatum]XP_029429151.1 tensin-4 [Rhinatrema bivittatum]